MSESFKVGQRVKLHRDLLPGAPQTERDIRGTITEILPEDEEKGWPAEYQVKWDDGKGDGYWQSPSIEPE